MFTDELFCRVQNFAIQIVPLLLLFPMHVNVDVMQLSTNNDKLCEQRFAMTLFVSRK